ncbi:hypothetical protein PVA38_10990 [Streptococcus pneumoniae D39]|nr:hypothetical protein PVA38_10990 [Streptococcus pneumoniae D39]
MQAISWQPSVPVSYTHLRAHETVLEFVCRLLLEKIHLLCFTLPPALTTPRMLASASLHKPFIYWTNLILTGICQVMHIDWEDEKKKRGEGQHDQ